jgi:hypothetical protein
MPFTIVWDDPGRTVIFVSAIGEWSIEEFMGILNQVITYHHKVSHPVHVIIDVRQSALPPLGIVWHSRFVFQRLPGNFVGGVVVTHDALWRNVVTTVRALYVKKNNRLAAVRTMEEARAIVQKWRTEGTF